MEEKFQELIDFQKSFREEAIKLQEKWEEELKAKQREFFHNMREEVADKVKDWSLDTLNNFVGYSLKKEEEGTEDLDVTEKLIIVKAYCDTHKDSKEAKALEMMIMTESLRILSKTLDKDEND